MTQRGWIRLRVLGHVVAGALVLQAGCVTAGASPAGRLAQTVEVFAADGVLQCRSGDDTVYHGVPRGRLHSWPARS